MKIVQETHLSKYMGPGWKTHTNTHENAYGWSVRSRALARCVCFDISTYMRTLQHYLQRKNETNVKMNVAKENNAVQCRSWVCSDDPVDKPCCVVSSVGIGSIISSQHWFVLLSYSPPWVSTSVVCVWCQT